MLFIVRNWNCLSSVWGWDTTKQSGTEFCSHQTHPVQQRAGMKEQSDLVFGSCSMHNTSKYVSDVMITSSCIIITLGSFKGLWTANLLKQIQIFTLFVCIYPGREEWDFCGCNWETVCCPRLQCKWCGHRAPFKNHVKNIVPLTCWSNAAGSSAEGRCGGWGPSQVLHAELFWWVLSWWDPLLINITFIYRL